MTELRAIAILTAVALVGCTQPQPGSDASRVKQLEAENAVMKKRLDQLESAVGSKGGSASVASATGARERLVVAPCRVQLEVDLSSGRYRPSGGYWTVSGTLANNSDYWIGLVNFGGKVKGLEGRVIGDERGTFQVSRLIRPHESVAVQANILIGDRHKREPVSEFTASPGQILDLIDAEDRRFDGFGRCDVAIVYSGKILN